MKHLIILLMMLMPVTAVSAQDSFFKKLGSTKGVSSVYISKSMLAMMPDIKAGDKDMSKVTKKLDYMQILNSETPQGAATLKQECLKIMKQGGYETLMNVSDKGEKAYIYVKELSHGKRQFVMLNIEKSETTVFVMTGKVTLKEIKDVMGK